MPLSYFPDLRSDKPRPPGGAGQTSDPGWPRPAANSADDTALPTGFAHDLNNYISIITGYSEVCLEKLHDGDEKILKYMREIHGAAQLASDLTRQLIMRQKKKLTAANNFPSGTESILIVEDEKALRELLRTVLEQHGYRVTFASDGETAANFFSASSQSFDVVLLDLQLPDMSGLAVLEQIKKLRPTQKFIAISGYTSPETDAALRRLGVRDHLLKPYHLGDLGRTLRNVVARAA
ncbi:MAG TPA: response regulator [Opitutaceae bacterium]|nr:response regulator [Opitutaceae bacterium]